MRIPPTARPSATLSHGCGASSLMPLAWVDHPGAIAWTCTTTGKPIHPLIGRDHPQGCHGLFTADLNYIRVRPPTKGRTVVFYPADCGPADPLPKAGSAGAGRSTTTGGPSGNLKGLLPGTVNALGCSIIYKSLVTPEIVRAN